VFDLKYFAISYMLTDYMSRYGLEKHVRLYNGMETHDYKYNKLNG
jgi:hypothetical protein